MENGLLFEEHQLWGIWTFLLLLAVNAIVVFAHYKALRTPGNSPAQIQLSKRTGSILIACVMLGSVFFLCFRLDTQIRTDGIYVRYFPIQLQFKNYSWQKIDSVFVKKYHPMSDYGGWGMRGRSNNKVYSMSGDEGIQLVFSDSSRFLIGTQHPAEAAKALQLAKQFNHLNH